MSEPWEDRKSGLFTPEGENPNGLFDTSFVPPPYEPSLRFPERTGTAGLETWEVVTEEEIKDVSEAV
jgi:hypothetical protein